VIDHHVGVLIYEDGGSWTLEEDRWQRRAVG